MSDKVGSPGGSFMERLIKELRGIADDLEHGRPVRRLVHEAEFEPVPDGEGGYIKGDKSVSIKITFIGNEWRKVDIDE
jgi:hypothetical protein